MALDKNVAKKFISEWIHSDKNKNDWFSTNPCGEIDLPKPEEPITRKVLFEKTNKNNWEYIGMQFIETHLKTSADDMINSMFLSMYSQKIASEMHIDTISEKTELESFKESLESDINKTTRRALTEKTDIFKTWINESEDVLPFE